MMVGAGILLKYFKDVSREFDEFRDICYVAIYRKLVTVDGRLSKQPHLQSGPYFFGGVKLETALVPPQPSTRMEDGIPGARHLCRYRHRHNAASQKQVVFGCLLCC